MKFYTFGGKEKPSLLLLPGTCMHWKKNFGNVIEDLSQSFCVVCVSYDGFDETEDTIFPDMIRECEKIEAYILKNFNGKIFCAYGCSLGGSFVSLLIQRKKIHMNHGILGSSDMDQMSKPIAVLLTKMMIGMIYPMLKTSELSIRQKKRLQKQPLNEYNRAMLEMMGVGKGGMPYLKKESVANQFCTDLYTKVDDNIEVSGTKIHVFYAKKMEKKGQTKYLNRYLRHFVSPDIVEHEYNHEELLLLYPKLWVAEVKRVCEVA